MKNDFRIIILFSSPIPNNLKEYFSGNSFCKASINSLLEGSAFIVFIFITKQLKSIYLIHNNIFALRFLNLPKTNGCKCRCGLKGSVLSAYSEFKLKKRCLNYNRTHSGHLPRV